MGRLLDVRNPVMRLDRFTDRWPENRAQQQAFAAALTEFADGLEAIRTNGMELEDVQEWLRLRFGARVVTRSVQALNERNGRALHAGTHGYTRGGGLYVPAAPAIVAASSLASVVPARAHTNMGDRRP